MKHIPILALYLLFTLVTHHLYGQEKFESGYVITLQQDTVRGVVEKLKWQRNPNKILFKATQESPVQTFGLDDIAGFGVGDRHYVRATVKTDDNPHSNNDLTYSRAYQTRQQTVFLQLLAGGGMKSLFYYRDERGRDNFYIRNGSYTYELLINYRYLDNRGTDVVIVKVESFKMQLREYLAECPSVQERTISLSYSYGSIGKLFADYYATCSSAQSVALPPADRLSLQFGGVVGGVRTQYRFSTSANLTLPVGTFPASYSATGGVFLNIGFPRTSRRFSIYNELILASSKAEKVFQERPNNIIVYQYDIHYGFTYLKLNNMLRFSQPLGQCTLYFNAGIANGIAIAETNYQRKSTIGTSSTIVEDSKAMDYTRKHEQGILVGLGASFKRFSLEARYEKGNGISDYSNYKSETTRYYALLGYRLK